MNDGEVLVEGGWDAASASATTVAELFDPATDSWSATGSLNKAHQSQAVTKLANGRVLVAGGLDASDSPSTDVEIYDPSSGAWSTAAPLPSALAGAATAVTMSDGRVLVTGAYDSSGNAVNAAALYDPSTDAWTSTGPMTAARGDAPAVLLSDDDVLVAGGLDGDNTLTSNDTGVLSSTDLYSPSTNSWSAGPSMPSGGSGTGGPGTGTVQPISVYHAAVIKPIPARANLYQAVMRGFSTPIHCSLACTITAAATLRGISASLYAMFDRVVMVGKSWGKFPTAGRGMFHVGLTKQAKRALRRLHRSVRISLWIHVRDGRRSIMRRQTITLFYKAKHRNPGGGVPIADNPQRTCGPTTRLRL